MLLRFSKTSKRPAEPDISLRLRHPVASRTQLGSYSHNTHIQSLNHLQQTPLILFLSSVSCKGEKKS